MERKWQLLTFATWLSLLMITSHIAIFASYKTILFKSSFNSIALSESQLRFALSENITTKEPLILPGDLRSTIMPFSPSKYKLIVKLKLETGLSMYASALEITVRIISSYF